MLPARLPDSQPLRSAYVEMIAHNTQHTCVWEDGDGWINCLCGAKVQTLPALAKIPCPYANRLPPPLF